MQYVAVFSQVQSQNIKSTYIALILYCMGSELANVIVAYRYSLKALTGFGNCHARIMMYRLFQLEAN